MKVIRYQLFTCLIFFLFIQVNTVFAEITSQGGISLSPTEQRWIANHPIVSVAGGKEWAPIDFSDEYGKHQGFTHDYLEIISKKTGLKFSYNTDSWSKAYNSVLTKKNTLLPALYQSPERDELLLFSNEYHHSLDYFFTRNDILFDQVSPFKNKKLALVKDYAIEPVIRKTYPNLQIISTESIESAINMVLEGKADLIYDSYTTIQYLLNKSAISNFIPYKTIENAQTYPIKMATTKDNPELISIINKGMAAISIDDTSVLLKKWRISSDLTSPQQTISSTLDLNSKQRAWIASHPIIKVAADTTWFPFDFVDENNEHKGLSRDVLDFIEKKTGLYFESIPGAWRDSLARVENGTLDLLPAIYKTPEREKKLTFSQPYYHPSTYFFTHDSSKLLPNSDISQSRIALVKGNAASQAVIQKYPKMKITYTKTIAQAIQLLVDQKVDLIVGANSVVNYERNKKT